MIVKIRTAWRPSLSMNGGHYMTRGHVEIALPQGLPDVKRYLLNRGVFFLTQAGWVGRPFLPHSPPEAGRAARRPRGRRGQERLGFYYAMNCFLYVLILKSLCPIGHPIKGVHDGIGLWYIDCTLTVPPHRERAAHPRLHGGVRGAQRKKYFPGSFALWAGAPEINGFAAGRGRAMVYRPGWFERRRRGKIGA